MLAQLPLSLLITSFALTTVSALPVNLNVLTPDTFQSTITEGVWLVEHFSPYCGHCKHFAPTWEKLVEDTENVPNPGIHLAQVNCAVHGDLCDANKVKGYPQLNLYRDGVYVEEYKGRRDYELLTLYISEHAKPTSPAVDSLSSAPSHSSAIAVVPSTTAQAELFHIQTARADLNPSGTVLALNDNVFHDVINGGPTFIKFFAPWCGHCKKLAPTWTQLARHMQHKLNVAEVNCDDHPSLCKSQDVKGYPMLVYYSNGGKTEYTGGRKFDQLKAFTDKAAAPPMQPIQSQDLDAHLADNSVLYLLLHTPTEINILADVRQASHPLLGSPPIVSSDSSDLFARFSVPSTATWALIALKDHDALYPSVLSGSLSRPSERELSNWLFAHRLPTALELTQDTFQDVMNSPRRPLIVLAAVTKDTKQHVSEKFRDIGKRWKAHAADSREINNLRDGGVVFTWMDADKWASWLNSMYGIKVSGGSTDTPIVIADHKNLLYYDRDELDRSIKLTSTSIFSALDHISRGGLDAKHSENFVERMARYLNERLTSLEGFVTTHPLFTIGLVGIFIAGLVLAFRSLLSDDASPILREQKQGPHRKSNRLD